MGIIFLLIPLVNLLWAQSRDIAVYLNNRALIQEVRRLEFPKGEGLLPIDSFPKQIDISSVSLAGEGIVTLDLSYQSSAINDSELLWGNLGKEISLVLVRGDTIKGILVSLGDLILLQGEGGHLFEVSAHQVLAKIFPLSKTFRFDTTHFTPKILWRFISDRKGERPVRFHYLTEGISWEANYFFYLPPVEVLSSIKKTDQRRGVVPRSRWEGRALLTNSTSISFPEAKVILVAGELHWEKSSERPLKAPYSLMASRDTWETERWSEPLHEEAFEYHTYTIERPVSLRRGEVLQVGLVSSEELKDIEKIYQYDWNANRMEGNKENRVRVGFRFANVPSNGLGKPMPRGRVRIYQENWSGGLLLLGEDKIDDLSVGEEIFLKTGYVFDVEGDRVVKESTREGKEQWVQIQLKNRK
ncbi:MAG: DUF4139 domain-containing protein, partial [bacterium]